MGQPYMLSFFKYIYLVYTHSVILVIQAIWLVSYLGLWRYIHRCRELGVLPKFQSKTFLKIHEYLSADDFEGKKRLHSV